MSTRPVLRRAALALLIGGGGFIVLVLVLAIFVLPARAPAWYKAGEVPSELDWDRASDSIRDAYARNWAVKHKWHGITGNSSRYPSQEYRVINPENPSVEIGPPERSPPEGSTRWFRCLTGRSA